MSSGFDAAQRNDLLLSPVGSLQGEANRLIRSMRATDDGQREFFDVAAFPWVSDVESHWPGIRRELDRLLDAVALLPGFEEIQPAQQLLSRDRRWKVFPLYAYGQVFEKNQARCPETTRAIRKIPGLQAAMFSILQSRKELKPHTGNYCGVLRYHMGLKVPRPRTLCGIQVGRTTAHWDEGKSLIFDDTHMHSAWNRSDEERVVLFVDFERPLPPGLAPANHAVIQAIGRSAFIEDFGDRWKAWENVNGPSLDRVQPVAALAPLDPAA